MTCADENARDDAIVLAAPPATRPDIARWAAWPLACHENMLERISAVKNALRRLKRANLARYVRETKRWEEVK